MKKHLNISGASKETIIRTLLLVLALVNQVLTALGKPVIPVSDDELSALISTLFTIATALWAWWKNNSVTAEAQAGDATMKALAELPSVDSPEEEG